MKKTLLTVLAPLFFTTTLFANSSGGLIQGISLSQHLKDNMLNLAYAKITDDDMPSIINFLANHPEITDIDLSKNSLTDKSLKLLSTTSTLHKLILNGYCINGANPACPTYTAVGLGYLAKNTNIKWLELVDDNLNDEAVIALNQSTSIQHLNLSLNSITDISVSELAKNPAITYLDLWATSISPESAIALASSASLETLILRQTNTGNDGAIALANNAHLRNLDLAMTEVNDEGVIAIAKFSHVKTLSVGGNYLSLQTAIALANNNFIEDLSISGPYFSEAPIFIGDEGVKALAKNKHLIALDVMYQHISATGAKALAENHRIKKLNISANRINDEGGLTLAKNSYEKLAIGSAYISDVTAITIAKMKDLTDLYLYKNNIGDKGAEALAKSKSIQYLELIGNQIGDAGAVAFARNTTLVFLDLQINPIGKIGTNALENSTIPTVLYDSASNKASTQADFMSMIGACKKMDANCLLSNNVRYLIK